MLQPATNYYSDKQMAETFKTIVGDDNPDKGLDKVIELGDWHMALESIVKHTGRLPSLHFHGGKLHVVLAPKPL